MKAEPSPRRRSGLCIAAAALLLPALVSTAGVSAAIADETFEVEVWVIRATRNDEKVSPELKELAEELKKQFKYTGFKLEKRATGRVQSGKPFSTALLGSYKAKVTPTAREKERVTFKLEVLEQVKKKDVPRLKTTVTVDRDKFQLTGGWKIDSNGDVLICAVRVK